LVLIAFRSAQLRDSLVVLLRAIPQIGEILQADDGPSAASIGDVLDLTLTPLDLGSSDHEALSLVRNAWPKAQCIALIEDESGYQSAEVGGADFVLVKGVRPEKLIEAIEALL
jgi:DNA-binding NarL/FixJ family response regulator